MKPKQKLIVTAIWALAVLLMIAGVGTGLWAHRQPPLEIFFDAPAFSLIDQNGQPITDQQLKGNVWVAMVFFASCPGVCPVMNSKLAKLQKTVPNPDVKIVSISIDPEHDTPEMLRGYAEGYGADQSRWFFLTGKKEDLFATARGLNLAAEPAHDGQPITHTQKMLLIDRENHVRGIYDSSSDDEMQQLAADAKMLAAD
jgi:protein SCO1/2